MDPQELRSPNEDELEKDLQWNKYSVRNIRSGIQLGINENRWIKFGSGDPGWSKKGFGQK